MSKAARLLKFGFLLLFIAGCSEDDPVSSGAGETAIVEALKTSDALKMYKDKLDVQIALLKSRIDIYGAIEVSGRLSGAINNENSVQLAFWSGFNNEVEFENFQASRDELFIQFKNKVDEFTSVPSTRKKSLMIKALTGEFSSFSNVFKRTCKTELIICERNARNEFYLNSTECAGASLLLPNEWFACPADANLQFVSSQSICTNDFYNCVK